MRQNSKTQNVRIKKNKNVTKLKNSKWDKTQNGTEHKNLNMTKIKET